MQHREIDATVTHLALLAGTDFFTVTAGIAIPITADTADMAVMAAMAAMAVITAATDVAISLV
jgi:hypothetical protein